MSNRRVLKAAQAIREVVSMAILTDLKDPRVKDVTVTFVEVSADMRMAKVHVSVMGDDTKQNLCLRGLQNSAGYLQSKVGRRIDTRYTPKIQFLLDKGMKHAMMVTRILEEVLPAENGTEESEPTEEYNFDEYEHSGFDPEVEAVTESQSGQQTGDASGEKPEEEA